MKITFLSDRPEGRIYVENIRDLLRTFSDLEVEWCSHATFSPHDTTVHLWILDIDSPAVTQSVAAERLQNGLSPVLILVDLKSSGESTERALRMLGDGIADDVLCYPFRELEVLGKLKLGEIFKSLEAVGWVEGSLEKLVESFRGTLAFAEKMQQSKLKSPIPPLKGVDCHARYIAGTKAGGDYFEVFPSKDQSRFSIVMTESSTYGLSSAVLSALMRVSGKLVSQMKTENERACVEFVKTVADEILLTLGPKDELSFFFGVFSRPDLQLRYVNVGKTQLFSGSLEKPYEVYRSEHLPFTANRFPQLDTDYRLKLETGQRLVILSRGFVDLVGGDDEVRNILDSIKSKNAKSVLTEMTYKVKSDFNEPDDLPARDCTGVILEIQKNALRLA